MNKALKLAQRDALAARVLIQRGDLFRSQGKYGSAIDDFNRAISLDPRNLAAYVGLGETYRAKGEPDQAIDRYRAAMLLDDTYVDAHVKLGNAYREAGRFDEAVASTSGRTSCSRRPAGFCCSWVIPLWTRARPTRRWLPIKKP